MHRNPFKPHADHPSLNEVMRETAPPDCPHCIDDRDCSQVAICNAINGAYAGDAKQSVSRLLQEKGRV